MREVVYGFVTKDGRRAIYWLINDKFKHVGWLMPDINWKKDERS
jgi:hypothetical protein